MTHNDSTPMRRLFQNIAADLNDVLDGMIEAQLPLFAPQIQSALAKAWAKKWPEISRSLARSISRSMSEIGKAIEAIPWQEYGEAFQAAEWPLTPSVPLKLMNEVRALHQVGQATDATMVVLSCYHANDFERLVYMVERWATCPLMASRMLIIRDALEAHRQQKYTLSLPALLPQIEGVLMDYLVSQGLGEQEKKELRSIAKKYQRIVGEAYNTQSILIQIAADTLLSSFESLYTPAKLQRIDFWEELKKPPGTRRVNRHTVLHGVAVRYNKAEYSLKGFLFLDTLLSFFLCRPSKRRWP